MHRSLVRLVLAALAVMAPGCNREQAPEAEVSDAKASDAKTIEAPAEDEAGGCDAAHGKALEQELLAQCAVAAQELEWVELAPLPWKAAPSAFPEDAMMIVVDPRGASVSRMGVPIAFDQLPVRFAEERELLDELNVRLGQPKRERWMLMIEGTTPRTDVAVVLKVLEDAGLRQGYLRLGVPTGPLPAPRDSERLAELGAKLSKVESNQRARLIAEEIEAVLPACPPAGEAFSAAATYRSDERCDLLARDLAKALVSCGCAEEAELMTIHYAVTVGVRPREWFGTTVAVTLDPATEPVPGAVWSEIVANLDEAKLGKLWVGPV